MDVEFLCKDLKNGAYAIYSELNILIKELGKENLTEYELVFEIIDENKIDGKARHEGTKDCISISKGVISRFFSYFKKVNEYYINNVLEKVLSDKDPEEIEQMSMEGVTLINGIPTRFDSKDVVRERTKLLEIFVARFILVHEMGHLFNGHCEYLNEKEKGFKYMPMYEASAKEEIALTRRTLEMDADAFAATHSFFHLIYLHQNFDKEVNCAFVEPMELFYLWSFALRSHFLVCEDYLLDKNKFTTKMCHLPSCARWRMIMDVVMEMAERLEPNAFDSEQIQKLFVKGVLKAEKVFNDIKYTEYSFIDELNNNDEFAYYRDEVNRHWSEIVDKVELFSRVPLFKECI